MPTTLKELLPIIAPLLVLQLILMAVALTDLIRREPERVRGPKWAWVIACVVFSMVGPIAYFVAGRQD